MTLLGPERLHELDVILYLREWTRIFPEQPQYKIAEHFNAIFAAHGKDDIVEPRTIKLMLMYDEIHKWEWVSYFTQRGYTPKQIGQIMGISPRTVSNILYRDFEQNPTTLQRWLDRHEIDHDMYGMQQATQVKKFILPSRDFAALLRQSIRVY